MLLLPFCASYHNCLEPILSRLAFLLLCIDLLFLVLFNKSVGERETVTLITIYKALTETWISWRAPGIGISLVVFATAFKKFFIHRKLTYREQGAIEQMLPSSTTTNSFSLNIQYLNDLQELPWSSIFHFQSCDLLI